MLNIINKTKYNDLKKFYPLLNQYYKKTLKVLKLEDEYELSVILCGPLTIKRINREYRNIDRETDVISFALIDDENEYGYDQDIELGDIFINRNKVLTQAKEYDHSIAREFVFLFVHGLLHLFGYDHMNKQDEKKMFALQKKILADLK